MANQSWRLRLRNALWSIRDNKKARLWFIVFVSVIVAFLTIGVVALLNRAGNDDQTSSEILNIDVNDTEESSVSIRFIDGVEVEAGKENLFPVAVMIENLSVIRPQAGLQQANVVYEALAEGGITRFEAVYANDEPLSEIGPVRSARSYFVDWAQEYQAMYAHVGGSPQAIEQLYNTEEVINLDQMGNAGYFWRKEEVPAPHNLFTSSDLLALALRDNSVADKAGTYSPWKFESETPLEQRRQDEQRVHIPFSSVSYDVDYNYDKERNLYKRSNGGVEHTDALTGEQITVRNIAVQFVPTTLAEEDTGRLEMETIGEGKAIVIRDGQAIEGMWRKENEQERTRFYTTNDEEISFIPGNIWVEVLPDDRNIEYN